MIRKLADQQTVQRSPQVQMQTLLDPAQMFDAGRLYARITIAPGGVLGPHTHTDEMESFVITKGTCLATDDGEQVQISAGDILITADGGSHALHNNSNEDVELIALIISRKQGQPGVSK